MVKRCVSPKSLPLRENSALQFAERALHRLLREGAAGPQLVSLSLLRTHACSVGKMGSIRCPPLKAKRILIVDDQRCVLSLFCRQQPGLVLDCWGW